MCSQSKYRPHKPLTGEMAGKHIVRRLLNRRENPMNTPQGYLFRYSFWHLYLGITFWGLLFTLVFFIANGFPDWYALVLGFVGGALMSMLLTAITVYYYPWYVYSEGLHGYNQWNFPRKIVWADIIQVKKTNFGGLNYLRVFTRGSRSPLWLPLFFENMRAFQECLARFAPEQNPLASYFRNVRA
jgi:hypothetical protein